MSSGFLGREIFGIARLLQRKRAIPYYGIALGKWFTAAGDSTRCRLAWTHLHGQLTVCIFRQRKKCGIVSQRCEDRIHACFHHLFCADGLIALILEEVAF